VEEMIRPHKFLSRGKGNAPAHPIIKAKDGGTSPAGKPLVDIEAVIHQDDWRERGEKAPPMSDPGRYMKATIGRDEYDALPECRWDCDDQGNIATIQPV
jgi:hypothetical protein